MKVYFGLNFASTLLAFIVSWRAALFFATYIFLIWFYSHKLKRYLIVGNLMAALLAIFPFFGNLLYYFYKMPINEIESLIYNLELIFTHASFLFILILIRELIKDLENIKGDLVNNYQTIPVVYGENASKKIITILIVFTLIPVYFLVDVFNVGYMDIYFYGCLIVLIFFGLLLWKSDSKPQFLKLHNMLKILIIAGVFSIVLIDPSVLIHGKQMILQIPKY